MKTRFASRTHSTSNIALLTANHHYLMLTTEHPHYWSTLSGFLCSPSSPGYSIIWIGVVPRTAAMRNQEGVWRGWSRQWLLVARMPSPCLGDWCLKRKENMVQDGSIPAVLWFPYLRCRSLLLLTFFLHVFVYLSSLILLVLLLKIQSTFILSSYSILPRFELLGRDRITRVFCHVPSCLITSTRWKLFKFLQLQFPW